MSENKPVPEKKEEKAVKISLKKKEKPVETVPKKKENAVTKAAPEKKKVEEKDSAKDLPKHPTVRAETPRKKGIVHIYASHNNTKIILTDLTGAETIASCSGGKVVKSQHKEGSPYAALKIAEIIANEAKEKGIFEVEVRVRAPGGNKSNSPGQGSEASIRSLTRNGLRIISIKNVTPMPHDGCRKKKRFRGKRK